MCLNYKCPPEYVKCKDNLQCINVWRYDDDHQSERGLAHVCDHTVPTIQSRCADKSDLQAGICRNISCDHIYNTTGKHWKCRNETSCNNRINVNATLCDGRIDCSDGSDEFYGEDMKHFSFVWKCRHSEQCIRTMFLCDGNQDCRDGSDEIYADDLKERFGDRFWKCNYSVQCILKTNMLDNILTCIDGSDEYHSGKFFFFLTIATKNNTLLF